MLNLHIYPENIYYFCLVEVLVNRVLANILCNVTEIFLWTIAMDLCLYFVSLVFLNLKAGSLIKVECLKLLDFCTHNLYTYQLLLISSWTLLFSMVDTNFHKICLLCKIFFCHLCESIMFSFVFFLLYLQLIFS